MFESDWLNVFKPLRRHLKKKKYKQYLGNQTNPLSIQLKNPLKSVWLMLGIKNDKIILWSNSVSVHRNLQNQMQIPQQQPLGKYTVQQRSHIVNIHLRKTDSDSSSITSINK